MPSRPDDDAIGALLAATADDVLAAMDPADEAVLDSISPERRSAALRRLAVLRIWSTADRGETFPTVADAARWAAVSRSAFYRMVEAVPKHGLFGLGLHLRRGSSARASEVAAAEPLGASTLPAPDAAGGGCDGVLTSSSRAARAGTSRRGLVGQVSLDAASMDLRDGSGARQRLHAMVDAGTSLVLAWIVGPDLDLGDGYARLGALWRARAASVRPATLVGIAPDPAGGSISAHLTRDSSIDALETLSSMGVRLDLDARRLGAAVVGALGERLGGHALAVGFAPADRFHRSRVRTSLPVVTDGALARIADAIDRHNADALRRARSGNAAAVAELVDGVAERLAGLRP